ncbi:hypothetical protein [uncultured Parvibaculum sp.]|uniref:hypothetical protein n=1 Tax=uncultured Parvibaculum sp. TaxID=291828 RepID=UPI0030EE5E68
MGELDFILPRLPELRPQNVLKRHHRPMLCVLRPAVRIEIDAHCVEVDGIPFEVKDGIRSGTGCYAQKNEKADVRGLRGIEQRRKFLGRQPPFAGIVLALRVVNFRRDGQDVRTLLAKVIKRGAQHTQFPFDG